MSRSKTRCTSDSLRLRYSIRSAMVPILSLCSAAKSMRSGSRAMLPSSRMISHSTAAGWSPASCARSQQASVWPARTSTPPACAMSGNTWPGWTMSAGVALGEAATLMVCARSAAEMPVVTPEAASMDTVKLVPCTERLRATIGKRFRRSACASVIGMQTRPLPNFAMKLIFSAVTNSAAKMRSPSFSRSSSSTSTAMRPAFSSAMISWIELRLMGVARVRARILRLSAPHRPRRAPHCAGAAAPAPAVRSEGSVRLLLAARLVAFDFLADARALARARSHVIELGAAHVAFPLQLDRVDRRGISLKGALDALARGHLAHGERGIDAAVLLGDHHALVGLHALALAFDDADVDDHGVARGKLGELLPHALDFLFFELLNDVHRFAPSSSSRLNSSSSLRSLSLIPRRSSSSGLRSQVRPSDCLSRQRSIWAWWPESSTGGTTSPAYVSGRVYCGQSSSPFTNESCSADNPSPSAPGNCRTTASISAIAASSPPERT